MAAQVQTISVVIASPGDVPAERQLALSVAQKVDQKVAVHLGIVVRAWGWEAQRPGLGRAQDLINPRVDECDLLVGIINERWGTPTGEFTSGFEEEFERVRKRKDSGEQVDAMVFARVLDPGADVSTEMQSFRERLKALALYREYATNEQFREELFSELADFVAERGAAMLDHGHSGPNAIPADDGTQPPTAGGSDETQQAIDALRHVTDGLASNAEIELRELVRAHLAVSAEMHKEAGTLLDIQEVFRVYIRRDGLELSSDELYLLGRSKLSEGSLCPGWALLNQEDGFELLFMNFADEDPAIRAAVIDELGIGGLVDGAKRMGADDPSVVVKRLANDQKALVHKAMLRQLSVTELPIWIETASELIREGRGDEVLFDRLFQWALDDDSNEALGLLCDQPTLSTSGQVRQLLERADQLDTSTAGELLAADGWRQSLAVLVLGRTGSISEAALRSLLQNESVDVRRAAARGLIHGGHEITKSDLDEAISSSDFVSGFDADEEDIRVEWLKTQDELELLTKCKWFAHRVDESIRSLAARFPDTGLSLARKAFVGEFEEIREDGIRSLQETFGDSADARTEIAQLVEEYGELSDDTWIEGSLMALADGGNQADSVFARDFIESRNPLVRRAALKLLANTTDSDDAPVLLEYASRNYDDEALVATEAAVQLLGDPDLALEAASKLERSERVLPAVLKSLRRSKMLPDFDRWKHLMRDEWPSVRKATAGLLLSELSSEELATTLDWYLNDSSRYFDIISTIDRLAFGPGEVAAAQRLLD